MELFTAEVRRLTHRRTARLLAALGLVLLLATMTYQFVSSNRDLAAAQRRAERRVARIETAERQFVAECSQRQQAGNLPPGQGCPTLSDLKFQLDPNQFVHDPRFHFRQSMPNHVEVVTAALAVLAFLLGASFIGADWHAGTLQALLFWEPRRLRVLAAKATALLVVLLDFGVLAYAVHYGASYLTAATRGTLTGVDLGFQASLALTAARGLAVMGFAGLLGFAIAGLARVTGAALGVGFAYFAILENLTRGLRPVWRRFLVTENVVAIITKVQVLPGHGQHFEGFGGAVGNVFRLSGWRASLTLGSYLAVLLGLLAVSFVRRDVT